MTHFLFNAVQIAVIIQAYQDGASLQQLAERYQCSYVTIRDYLHRAGVQRRPRGGANNPNGRRKL